MSRIAFSLAALLSALLPLMQWLDRRRVSATITAVALVIGAGIAVPVAMLRAAEEEWSPPHGAHTGSDRFSMFCVHDAETATYLVAYQGDFNSSSESTSNAKTRTWTENVTLTLKSAAGTKDLALRRDFAAPETLVLGGQDYDLTRGRLFLVNADRAVRQLAIEVPIVKDQASAKLLAGLIAAIPPQEQELIVLQPEHRSAQELFKRWQANARGDGRIPGGLIAELGRKVEGFTPEYGEEAAKKLAVLRPRIDASHDWPAAEAVALLDEVCAISTAPVEWLNLDEVFFDGAVQRGSPLPAKLKDAAWGPPAENGLRAAWLLKPRAKNYALGSVLKARVLFHNAGQEPVVFNTETWHQDDPHVARDAKGAEIKVRGTWYTGLTPLATYRLAPGDYCEVQGHGIAIGAGEYVEEHRTGSLGAVIEAKLGDEVRFSSTVDASAGGWTRPDEPKDPAERKKNQARKRIEREAPLPLAAADRAQLIRRVMLDLTGLPPTPEDVAAFSAEDGPDALARLVERILGKPQIEPWKGKLPTGEIKFRVTAADPNAAKAPRAAIGPAQKRAIGQSNKPSIPAQKQNSAKLQEGAAVGPVAGLGEPVKWSGEVGEGVAMTFGEELNGLRLGIRIAEDADWRIGKEVKVELWIANSGKKDVKFESTARNDLGLRVFMAGDDGVEHEGSISLAFLPIVLDKMSLKLQEAVKVREITVVFLPADGELTARLQPQFRLPPGEYRLRCEHELMRTVIKGADGKPIGPVADLWTGVLKSGVVDVTLVAPDAPPPKPRREGAKVDLRKDGRISLNRKKVTLEELRAQAAQHGADWRIVIDADQDVPYAKVVKPTEDIATTTTDAKGNLSRCAARPPSHPGLGWALAKGRHGTSDQRSFTIGRRTMFR